MNLIANDDNFRVVKERLQKFIDQHGLKHWSHAARKDAEFIEWVERQTSSYEDLTFAEKVYVACSENLPICENGGRKKFNSIEKGWRFCGRAAKCACAAASVSASCKASMAKRSKGQQATINAKRMKTNIRVYGVTNIGQTESAKSSRSDFYNDKKKVEQAVRKGRATMLSKYGVDNALKLPSVAMIRPTIASTLSIEARENRSRLRREKNRDGSSLRSSFLRLKKKFNDLGYEWLRTIETYKGVGGVDGREKYPFRCNACDLIFYDFIYDGWLPVCPKCNPPPPPSYVSREEKAVGDFIASLGVDIIRGSRRAIPTGEELDIFAPEFQVAIEYGGLHWHAQYASERRREKDGRGKIKDKGYHVAKMAKCAAAKIRLITMFSDEWLYKRDQVERRLRHLFNVEKKRVGARSTVCRSISHAEAVSFLERVHIQGAGNPALVRYGLYDNDALVAVMTLGQLRRSNNHKAEPGAWELYRFASDGVVIGGASKLFRMFVREHQPNIVRTFADLRWGTGQVYEKMGFEADGFSQPAYWYIPKGYQQRMNRYNFTKHKLVEQGFDKTMSESQIMRERGFDIIWDCGNARFVWKRGV